MEDFSQIQEKQSEINKFSENNNAYYGDYSYVQGNRKYKVVKNAIMLVFNGLNKAKFMRKKSKLVSIVDI